CRRKVGGRQAFMPGYPRTITSMSTEHTLQSRRASGDALVGVTRRLRVLSCRCKIRSFAYRIHRNNEGGCVHGEINEIRTIKRCCPDSPLTTEVSGAIERYRAHRRLSANYVVLTAAGAALLSSVFVAPPALSQEAGVEEVVVTGSRIRRQDFEANSPIVTVDEQLFEETNTVGVETILNQLPQFVPAVTQFNTGNVQNTATETVGASVVSLRGLGANRNLVLINGRRGQPVNAALVVDTNSIPSSMIQRVEIISGGA